MPKIERRHGIAVITPEGDINHAEMARVKNAITELVREAESRVVLDLSSVEHINYITLGVLVERAGRLRRCGGDLHLAGLSEYVRKILQFSGVEDLLMIFDSVAAAIASFVRDELSGEGEPLGFTAGANGSWVPHMH